MTIRERILEILKSTKLNYICDKEINIEVIDFKENEKYYITVEGVSCEITICAIIDNEMIVYKYIRKNKSHFQYEIANRYDLTFDCYKHYIKLKNNIESDLR